MASSNCDYCSHYVYDDEFDYYTCDVNLDEDEAVKFIKVALTIVHSMTHMMNTKLLENRIRTKNLGS